MKDRTQQFLDLCRSFSESNDEKLDQFGADVDAWTKSRETPLRLICENYKHGNLMDVVKFLVDNGADLKLKAKDGLSAADILLKSGFTL